MRFQRGQAIVLIAIMLAVLVAMAALAVDGSRAYAARRDLQAAVDAAALAAADNLQQTGNYPGAEAAAAILFGTNLRLYSVSCSGYGSPGASPARVTCNYPDGTILTQVVWNLGPQGSQFSLVGSRSLQLQFAKVLTNGANPTITGAASGGVNNLLFTPAVGALDRAGCGGAGGSALTLTGSGTLNVTGDVVSSGAVSLSGAGLRVAGDIYARCQATIPGSVTSACYPSGASTPCTYPDIAGATRQGFRFVDPNFPAPTVVGGSQSAPNVTVVLPSGVYTAAPSFGGGDCWFLSGGVYDWQAGYANSGDFVSNELKPPDEPDPADNTELAGTQFWNTNGVNCAGSVQLNVNDGPNGIPQGTWSFVLTSARTDNFNGQSYPRESAPSMCYQANIDQNDQNVQFTVSNVPGAMAYNIYAAPPGNGCSGPFGWAGTLQVSVPVQNNRTNSCPKFNGNGCSLGHESTTLDGNSVGPSSAPNPLASPGTLGSLPPTGENAPLGSGLPNQNPPRLPGAAGDRANENNCETTVGVYATCPATVTPGAVVFYMPAGACLSTNGGDTYVFSGYQYDWMSVYQPPANNCVLGFGARSNSAYVGLVYAPASAVSVSSSYSFEASAVGGLIGKTVSFSGTMPTIRFNTAYSPVPPASRLTG
ncbi:MAG TPA: pilus assembly protein TadG-related protein [Candidatus Dormibacteraeota bacterium]|nr:pilus assembly protein TadG-related protein [Candidatus Dormibacteraeota bacterium]